MSLRSVVRTVGASAPSRATVALLERLLRPRKGSLHALMYHRVAHYDERPDLHPALLSATPQAFDEQVAYLASTGRVVSLDDVVSAFRGERKLVAGAILVTFDDAYVDFAEHAWPSLARHDLPVTLFVPTAYPDQPERHFWWDRLHAARFGAKNGARASTSAGTFELGSTSERSAARRSIGGALQELDHAVALRELDELCDSLNAKGPGPAVLGWSKLVELHAAGVTLAAHTRTHPLLSKIPLEDALAEALGSHQDLVERLGGSPPVLAYPGGAQTRAFVEALDGGPFELAFTTQRGSNRVPGNDPWRLQRINVGVRSTLTLLRAQLLSVTS